MRYFLATAILVALAIVASPATAQKKFAGKLEKRPPVDLEINSLLANRLYRVDSKFPDMKVTGLSYSFSTMAPFSTTVKLSAVATNAGGLPDFVGDEVGGLVEMENAEELAARIIEELRENSKRTKGRHAAEYALAGFSWSGVAGKMVHCYEQILEGA